MKKRVLVQISVFTKLFNWYFATLLLTLLSVAGVSYSQTVAGETPGVAPIADLPTVSGIRVTSTPQRARLIVDLSEPASFAFVSLSEPNRIAVDVRANSFIGINQGKPGGQGLVVEYSIEQVDAERLRTNLVLSTGAQVQQAYVLEAFEGQPARLVVDIVVAADAVFMTRVAADKAAFELNSGGQAALNYVPDSPGSSQIETTTRPLILIDPGHGGVDGGSRTQSGVHEKDITLLFAIQLQEILIASGRFDVALTRDDDSFSRLEERVQLVRDNRADLLISVHADSFEDSSIRGASVYIRDEQATDVLDKVLAENENKVDLIAGFVLPEAEPVVVNILVDLMRREMRRQSFVAATAIVEQLKASIRVRRFPLRRADFFVLQSPDVPAILVELGFLSNRADSENLTSDVWRKRVSEAVARGVALYFDGVR